MFAVLSVVLEVDCGIYNLNCDIKHSASDAMLAVWSLVGPWLTCNLLLIMFWVSSYVKTKVTRFDTIIVVESIVVDGLMPGFTCLILGLGITYV
jgi:hypothetical protein